MTTYGENAPMSDVERQAAEVLAERAPASACSAAVLRRAIQIESQHAFPRTSMVHSLRKALWARERKDADAPRSAA